ncbi:hypothetical protein [Nocardiopsis xinjiangensis]|uniref:hypothetical protein n=1 Tax=Nocardiopsis xinjiangensis TaxID=124285 RepID=UPI00034A9CB3|nr:hypothetical protein [Nocardiopsis xinjiangensis]
MSDPYRFTQSPSHAGRREGDDSPRQGRHTVRVLLWLLIILGAAANAATSFGPFHPLVSVAFGLLTVLCIVLLVMHHLHHRK